MIFNLLQIHEISCILLVEIPGIVKSEKDIVSPSFTPARYAATIYKDWSLLNLLNFDLVKIVSLLI